MYKQNYPANKTVDTQKPEQFGSLLCIWFKHAEHLSTPNLFNLGSASDQEGIPAAMSRQKAGTLWCEETCWMGTLSNTVK